MAPGSSHARVVALLIVIAGLGLSFLQVQRSGRPDQRWWAWRAVIDRRYQDFSDPWPTVAAARRLAESPRALIYDAEKTAGSTYVYPPLAALLYRPLIGLDRTDFFTALSTANRILLAAIWIMLLLFFFHQSHFSGKGLLGLTAAVGCFYPLLRAVELNQATVLMTALLGTAFVLLQREREIPAGIALAAAAAIKPQLVLILPFLFWNARRMVWASLTSGALFLLVSVAFAGVPNHIYYLTRMLPTLSAGYCFYPNQSFNGLVNRLLVDCPLEVFALAPQTAAVQVLTFLFGLVAYGGGVWVARRQRHKPDVAVGLLGFGWLISTLVSPISWEHHYAPALFLFVWLYRRYVSTEKKPPVRLALAVAFSFVLIAAYFDVFSLHGAGSKLLVSYVFFGGGCLAATAGVFLDRQRGFV